MNQPSQAFDALRKAFAGAAGALSPKPARRLRRWRAITLFSTPPIRL